MTPDAARTGDLNALTDRLAAARAPLIAGLGCDMAGLAAVLTLAAATDAQVDHMHGTALSRLVGAMRAGRYLFTTPREAAARADVVLLVGRAGRDAAGLFAGPVRLGLATGSARTIIALPGGDDALAALATLAAALKGRGPAPAGVDVAALAGARFGVAVWSPAELSQTVIAALMESVVHLAETTRFTTLARLPGDNAGGFLQVCGWRTAEAPPLAFSGGIARPAARGTAEILAAGEADLMVWISAFRAVPPPPARCPVITLTPDPMIGPALSLGVGIPGIDHAALFHDPAEDIIRHAEASAAPARPAAGQGRANAAGGAGNGRPSVAALLGGIGGPARRAA